MSPERWTEGKVSDHVERLESGVSVNGEDRARHASECAVLKVSAVTYGAFDAQACKVIDGPELARARTNPRAGQVIISRSNTEALVGASVYVDSDYPHLFLSDKLWQTVSKEGANMKWLSYVLASPESRYRLSRLATGTSGSMKNITKGELLSLKVFSPPENEQAQIANILSTWDQAIETTEKLIENSKAQKKALMQQLLTGKKRYSQFIKSSEKQKTKYGDVPLDWLFQPISDIAWERNERAGINSELPVLACSKYAGFVDSLLYFKKKVYSDDTSNYKIVRRGCYGFPSNHIEEGSIGYQNICDAGMVSPIYSVFETSDRVHDGYLFRLLKTDHYRQIFQAYTSASVDRRGSLRWKEFSKIHVPVPSLAEQQRVAETIDTADKDLTNLKAQLLQLQAQKRGLMQQLLTGKRRVTLD